MRKRIGLDIDGTIALTHEKTINVLKAEGKLPQNVTSNDIKWSHIEWNPEEKTGFPGLSQEDLHNLFMRKDFWDDIPLFNGISDMVEHIGRNHDFYVCTDRRWYPELKNQTATWLQRERVPYKKLDCVKGKEKGKYAQENNLDIFIEDSIDNALLIAPYVKKVYLIEQPWNVISRSKLPRKIVRCYWNDIWCDMRRQHIDDFWCDLLEKGKVIVEED